ncbi:MAG TPA: DUF3147 family protein [Polyangia bacterium]|jgi:hypothetical protein
MKLKFDFQPLRQTSWRGHLLRFAMGGAVTVGTGLVAKAFGPIVGGVFLAFPAIFPVGLMMVEKLQNESAGPGARGHRARRAAIAQAVGAAVGSLGLAGFAAAAWLGLERVGAGLALPLALAAWAVAAVGGWYLRKRAVSRSLHVGHGGTAHAH